MTDEEIEGYRKRLNELTARCSDKYEESQIRKELKELAWEVGASTRLSHPSGPLDAETPGLIRNIHQALQTATMVNMCKAATQGYETAVEVSRRASEVSRRASKQFWIAAGIAIVSAVAAWVAAIRY